MYFTEYKRTGVTEDVLLDILLNHPGLTSEDGRLLTLALETEITTFSQRSRFGNVCLTVPEILLEGPRELFPYGEWFSEKIAMAVFHRDWMKRDFGVIPGTYWFQDGDLHFEGVLDPGSRADSVLFYADGMLKGYGGLHGLPTFTISDEVSGVILPMNFILGEGRIIVGSNIEALKSVMTRALSQYLRQAQMAIPATVS